MAKFDANDAYLILKIVGFIILVRLIVYFAGYKFYIPVLDELSFWVFDLIKIIYRGFAGLFPS